MIIKFKGNKPQYMTAGAAGADIISNEDVVIPQHQVVLISTGTYIQSDVSVAVTLLPRSSLTNKRGLILANSVGLIDSDYTGDIKVAFRNIGSAEVKIAKGERIGQLVVTPVIIADYQETEFVETERGDGGFGSTGDGIPEVVVTPAASVVEVVDEDIIHEAIDLETLAVGVSETIDISAIAIDEPAVDTSVKTEAVETPVRKSKKGKRKSAASTSTPEA